MAHTLSALTSGPLREVRSVRLETNTHSMCAVLIVVQFAIHVNNKPPREACKGVKRRIFQRMQENASKGGCHPLEVTPKGGNDEARSAQASRGS